MGTNLVELINNPLAQTGQSGSFLRLVLAEAALYGMPPQIIATLDDVASMLGFYDPLPAGQSGALAGPVVQWRTDRRQPSFERIIDVEQLAMKQRALIAFGGAPPDHMVGTAEIVNAMINLHKDTIPDSYQPVFAWASCHVHRELNPEIDLDKLRKDKGWPDVADADVLKPGGKHHPTYEEIAVNIRRSVIEAGRGGDNDPRYHLRPLAAHFLQAHTGYLKRAEEDGTASEVRQLHRAVRTIREMFPDLGSVAEELHASHNPGSREV